MSRKRDRRRSSNVSKQNSPQAVTKKAKGNSPTANNQKRSSDGAHVQFTGGDGASVASYHGSVATENNTVLHTSNLDGFGEVPADQQQPTKKFPPLVVKNIPLVQLKESLKAIGIKAAYKICRFGIKVVLPSKEDYQKAKQYLDRARAEYYTFDIQSEKPFKAVVRGLPIMEVDEIKSDLEDRYKLKPLAIFPMSRHNRVMEYRDCLYLVHFSQGSVTLGALKAVRVITDVIVSWEPYRGANKDVTQCMRCLHFGHGTRNCRLKPRCNLCSQGHLTDSCPSKDAEEIVQEIKCVNCGGAHRSTDRACPKREEFKNIRKQASTFNQPGRRRDRVPPPDPEEFPALCPGSQTRPARWQIPAGERSQSHRAPSAERPPGFQRIPHQDVPSDETRSANAAPLLYTAADLQHILNEMCDKLQQCSTRLEQVRLIGNLVLTYGY